MTHEKAIIRERYLAGRLAEIAADLKSFEQEKHYRLHKIDIWEYNTKAGFARRRKQIEEQILKLKNTKVREPRPVN